MHSGRAAESKDAGTGRAGPRRLGTGMRFCLRLLASCSVLAGCLAAPGAGLAADFALVSAVPALSAPLPSADPRLRADFSGESVSSDTRRIADWIVRSGDNRRLPFMIVDKANARMFLFASSGALLGNTPVLLGLARGDDSPPGIGDRPLALIRPAERITPAGRFEATLGRNLAGQDILWVDYAAAISVHRATDVKPGLTATNRLARLASPTAADNRISHGCINVSVAFFERAIRPAFSGTSGIVYILPETRSIHDEFPAAA